MAVTQFYFRFYLCVQILVRIKIIIKIFIYSPYSVQSPKDNLQHAPLEHATDAEPAHWGTPFICILLYGPLLTDTLVR